MKIPCEEFSEVIQETFDQARKEWELPEFDEIHLSYTLTISRDGKHVGQVDTDCFSWRP